MDSRRASLKSTFEDHAIFNLLLLDIFSPQKGDLLEIGCGTGEFLHLAREAGWTVVGIEPSVKACQFARDRYGLDFINDLWLPQPLPLANRSFDAVAWHVLEHIPQPAALLTWSASILKPEGRVFFSVPNTDSFLTSVLGPACLVCVARREDIG